MKTIERTLKGLTSAELEVVRQMAAAAGMTVEQWLDYVQKVQIYKNAEERLTRRPEEAA